MANNFDNLSDEELDRLVAEKLSKQASPPSPPPIDLNSLSDEELDKMVADKLAGRNIAQFPVSTLGKDQGAIVEGRPINTLEEQETSFSSRAQTFLENAGNEIAAGYLPQIQAGVEKLFGDPNAQTDAMLRAQGFQVPESSYVQMRDENIARQQAMSEANPKSAIAGKIGGIVTTMAPIAKGAQAVGLVGKGASGFSRLKDGAKMGAAMGAVYNPGDVEGVVNPLQVGERAKGAGTGAAFGVAGQGLGEGVAKVGSAVKNAPNTLEKLAKVKAFKAAGAMLKDFRNARGDKAAEEVGETLLNKGIVNAGDSIEDIASKTSAAKQEAGQRIRNVYDQVKKFIVDAQDDVVEGLNDKQKKLLELTKLDGKRISGKVRERLAQYQKNMVGSTEVKGKMDEILGDIENLGDDINLADLLEARNSLDKRINYGKRMGELPLLQQQMSAARQEITKAIQNRVRVVGKVTKNPKLIKELRQANKEFGQLATVEDFATDKIARENANRFFSLGDRLTSGAGATVGALSGDTPEERIKNGLIGFVGGRVAAKYGRHSTAMAAKGAQTLGKALKAPANFAKYGEPLIEAAKRSPEEFQALLQQFAQDPSFTKLATQGAK